MDGSMFIGTWWALLPPLLAIILAFVTKEVYSSLFLGVAVGCKAYGEVFLTLKTIEIIFLGVFAFGFGTVGGLLIGRLMCKLSHGQINPLIGSAGVSAVPMAARVSEDVGRETDPNNHLLMHAMGPNVAGVIGSAIAAGFLISLF